MAQRECRGYAKGGIAPHQADEADFGAGRTQCRSCYKQYADDWRAARASGQTSSRARRSIRFDPIGDAIDSAQGEYVSDEELASSRAHEYVPDPSLVHLWHAVVSAARDGSHPANLMFLGPSGSGKTDGAAFLAALVSLPFTKVDAASMTDAVDWFGTREVVAEDGASVTVYSPSTFVEAIQRPGVLLIDEVNRIRDEHRNVLLPLLDGTHRVTNPLTGESVVKDPRCFVIMSGNRGLQFTGTYAVDPALMTRALVVEFDYAAPEVEKRILTQASGCSDEVAAALVAFATETRARASVDVDLVPVSTRELMAAARLIAGGLNPDLAIKFSTINGASPEGGSASARATLEIIWAGVRRPS